MLYQLSYASPLKPLEDTITALELQAVVPRKAVQIVESPSKAPGAA